RLRRLVAAAFTPRQADRLRPRIEGLVQALLDDLPGRAEDGQADLVDLVDGLARPLPSRPARVSGSRPPCRPSLTRPGWPSRAAGPTPGTT
ncbi:MAG: cytochrome P450, partial [Streptosporangiaceae bacterium]